MRGPEQELCGREREALGCVGVGGKQVKYNNHVWIIGRVTDVVAIVLFSGGKGRTLIIYIFIIIFCLQRLLPVCMLCFHDCCTR